MTAGNRPRPTSAWTWIFTPCDRGKRTRFSPGTLLRSACGVIFSGMNGKRHTGRSSHQTAGRHAAAAGRRNTAAECVCAGMPRKGARKAFRGATIQMRAEVLRETAGSQERLTAQFAGKAQIRMRKHMRTNRKIQQARLRMLPWNHQNPQRLRNQGNQQSRQNLWILRRTSVFGSGCASPSMAR